MGWKISVQVAAYNACTVFFTLIQNESEKSVITFTLIESWKKYFILYLHFTQLCAP